MVEDGPLAVAHFQSRVDGRAFHMACEQRQQHRIVGRRHSRLRPDGVLAGIHELLFGVPDDVEQGINEVMRPQCVPQRARAQLFEHRFEVQPSLCRIGDVECRGDANQPSPLADHPLREGVIVGEWWLTCEWPVGGLGSFPHFVGGLARVGEDQLGVGGHASLDQGEEPLHDHPSLSAARSGDDEAWSAVVLDRFFLIGIEADGDHRPRVTRAMSRSPHPRPASACPMWNQFQMQ